MLRDLIEVQQLVLQTFGNHSATVDGAMNLGFRKHEIHFLIPLDCLPARNPRIPTALQNNPYERGFGVLGVGCRPSGSFCDWCQVRCLLWTRELHACEVKCKFINGMHHKLWCWNVSGARNALSARVAQKNYFKKLCINEKLLKKNLAARVASFSSSW